MGGFVKGDVVIVPYPYDDLSETKRRPGLVVAAPRGFSPIVAQITSQIAKDDYSVPIVLSDFVAGGLKKDSYVRTNILMTINPNRVVYKAGVLAGPKLNEIIDKIVRLVSA